MSRLDRVREEMIKRNLDAFIITTPKNIRYLANFTGSAGNIFLTKEKQYFITDFRYTEQAKNQAQGFDVIIHSQGIFNEIHRLVQENDLKSIGFEANQMNVSTYLHLTEMFDADLVQTTDLIEKIREVKDESEIALIRQACEITDQAFEHILTFIRPGLTEIQVANELERFLKEKGSTGMSFETIIASGVRSSMPHGVASDKVIEDGDMITLDFGCYLNGYTSDMTRTIAVGSVNPKLKEIYQIVLQAHELVNQQAKAGMTGKEVDEIARQHIRDNGYGDQFGHSTGHGIGLDVHEGPNIASRNDHALVPNNVITNEPGIYIEGLGGVRIEDDLLVTANGVESLNRSPKNLIIL